MKYLFASALLTVAVGCVTDGTTSPPVVVNDPPLVAGAPLPRTSGTYVSRYRVPVESELVAAADFAVDHAEWTVAGDAVSLHYNLPVGLVGGVLDLTLTGTLAADATTVELAGPPGVGTCVATAIAVTCREVFSDLGTLPISMARVQQTAATDYAGPVADRMRVAVVFGSDPIGIVELDLQAPVVEDNGGGGGGGGGGNDSP